MRVRGKTFSGATDTTLMNTIRMTLYNRFFMEEVMKINDYHIWVKGDDVCIFMKPYDKKEIEAAFFTVFARHGDNMP